MILMTRWLGQHCEGDARWCTLHLHQDGEDGKEGRFLSFVRGFVIYFSPSHCVTNTFQQERIWLTHRLLLPKFSGHLLILHFNEWRLSYCLYFTSLNRYPNFAAHKFFIFLLPWFSLCPLALCILDNSIRMKSACQYKQHSLVCLCTPLVCTCVHAYSVHHTYVHASEIVHCQVLIY